MYKHKFKIKYREILIKNKKVNENIINKWIIYNLIINNINNEENINIFFNIIDWMLMV
jgi:hypothetical protein